MSINIDKAKLIAELGLIYPAGYGFRQQSGSLTWETNYIKITSPASGHSSPCLVNTFPTGITDYMQAEVTVKVANLQASPSRNFFCLFSEPDFIGNNTELTGFWIYGTTYKARTITGGSATDTTLAGEDWTSDTDLKLHHQDTNDTVRFWVGGALKATHTTNVSTDQPRWYGAELQQSTGSYTAEGYLWLKLPNLIQFTEGTAV